MPIFIHFSLIVREAAKKILHLVILYPLLHLSGTTTKKITFFAASLTNIIQSHSVVSLDSKSLNVAKISLTFTE